MSLTNQTIRAPCKRASRRSFLFLACILVCSTSAKSDQRNVAPNRYFVIADPPNLPVSATTTSNLIKQDSAADLIKEAEHLGTSLFNHVAQVLPGAKVAHRFDTEWFSGMSLTVDHGTSIDDLLSLKGVKNVYPVGMIPHPNTTLTYPTQSVPNLNKRSKVDFETTKKRKSRKQRLPHKRANDTIPPVQEGPDSFAPHVMTGIDKLHAKGIKGKGQHVCVIDTGADYKNEILGGCLGPNCKLTTGWDFVGDDGQSPSSDPYTDCDVHATHILGTVGANSNAYGFVGVAPEVTLGLYRIFPCQNLGAPDDILVQALLKAEQDGCTVISASFDNGDSPWGENYPPQLVINRLSEKGIVFVASSGNAATQGIFSGQDPAIVPSALAVGSVDVNQYPLVYPMSFEDPSRSSIGYLSTTPLNVNGSLPVFFVSTSEQFDKTNCACSSLPSDTPDLANRLVVVHLGGPCNTVTQQINLAEYNARYIVLHDIANSPSAPSTFYTSAVDRGTYLLGMGQKEGLELLSYYKSSSNKTVNVNFQTKMRMTPISNPTTGGLVSTFSSIGPSNTLASPGTNVVGPGGVILSTFPRSQGGVGILSGTSMSTPLLAGSAALLLSSRSGEKLSSEQIRSLLSTNVDPVHTQTNGQGAFSSVLKQGVGLVAVDRAQAAKTLISPYVLALNDTKSAPTTRTISITNKNSQAVTYSFSSVGAQTFTVFAETANSNSSIIPSTPPTTSNVAQVSFTPTTLTVPAGSTSQVQVRVIPPAADAARYPLYSGMISISSNDALQQNFHVAYFGMGANLNDAPMLSTNLANPDQYDIQGLRYPFVTIGDLSNGGSLLNATSSVASCKRQDGLNLGWKLLLPSRQIFIDLIAANTNYSATIGHTSSASGSASQTLSNQLFNSTPIIGHIASVSDQDRDRGTQDRSNHFNGQIILPGSSISANKTRVDSGKPFRILLRVLKMSADPTLEANYDSYLSPPFQFID